MNLYTVFPSRLTESGDKLVWGTKRVSLLSKSASDKKLRDNLMDNSFDVDRARHETPASREIIHFNNAGASLMPVTVCEALLSYHQAEEQMGGYETAEKYSVRLNDFYRVAAQLIHCTESEIAFTENATRAWQLAFYSLSFKPGDKILTSIADYGSNVVGYIQQAKRYGVEVIFVPNDEYGQINTDALANLLDEKVKLISITHIPTGNGLVNLAKQVGDIARSAGIPYILDACQSVGHIPIDVEAIGCDVLCATGRKYLRGPRGTGFLYIRQSLLASLEPLMLDQHAAPLVSPTEYQARTDAKKFESWEQYCAGKYALTQAMEYVQFWGVEAIQARVYTLADNLRSQLAEVDGITLSDEGKEKSGIVTFYAKQESVDNIKSYLAAHKINVSISRGSGSLVSFQKRGLSEVVRASLHYFNTEQEIEYFVGTLREFIRQ